MKRSKYYQIGRDTGREIAECNIADYDLSDNEQAEKFMSDMLETESEHYRQFSPFEFLAREINHWERVWNRDGELWGLYETGVLEGIQSVVDENVIKIVEQE